MGLRPSLRWTSTAAQAGPFRIAWRIPPALLRHDGGTFRAAAPALGARDCQVIGVRGNANLSKTIRARSEAAAKVTFAAKPLLCARFFAFALVAQLDRASDFESEGREFESLRARQIPNNYDFF